MRQVGHFVLAGVTMGINCVPLIADLFLYSYADQWMANLLKGPSKQVKSQKIGKPEKWYFAC
jgi:hypothetical protein